TESKGKGFRTFPFSINRLLPAHQKLRLLVESKEEITAHIPIT
ncbi:MAG: hypothetical protein ACI9E1_001484, partial [Cryomorphaceae bacterium]